VTDGRTQAGGQDQDAARASAPSGGLAKPKADRAAALAETRTDAALERTFLAAERTLMAWLRTSLSMISFGFAIAKALEALAKSQKVAIVGPMGRVYSPATLGMALIAIGTLALVVAVLQHRATLRRMHERGLPPRWSLALTVAGLVALLGVFAFGSIALHF
jgi:putative membrane protein